MARKGIIMAGGAGTRLYPITVGLSKQLVPLYDKPMIYYPLSVLMLAGLREIAVITTPEDQALFQRVLGSGARWGLDLTYIAQPAPEGIAQAYVLAEDFLDGCPSTLILGDNVFFGHGLSALLARATSANAAATIFATRVADPERYGVVSMDEEGAVRDIIEKPPSPPSPYAVTGLYFLDHTAPERASHLTPSARGELEITCLLKSYLGEGALALERLGRGYAWLDTGTHAALLDAANFVATLQERQGLQVGCPEEIAWSQGWIDDSTLARQAALHAKTRYGKYLQGLLDAA